MKVYEIKKKENAPNVFGISLVGVPAMESNYVRLSKENTIELSEKEKIELSKSYDIKLKEYNKEKRLLLGLVLEPNKLIYRYDEETKEEYYITISEETTVDLAHEFIKNSNQSYSTIEHDGRELDGVTFVENWIVEDSNIDKSALYGLNFKKGSWVAVAKIDNDTLWNDYIETGVVQGFSIDAMVSLEEVNLNKQTEKMSEQKNELLQYAKDAIDTIRKSIGLVKEVEEEKEEVKMAEPMAEEDVEEPTTEAPSLETVASDIAKIKDVFKEMGIELSSTIKEALKPIQDANLELTKQVETLQTEVLELSKQPASKKITSQPTSVDFSKMTELQKRQYHRKNG